MKLPADVKLYSVESSNIAAAGHDNVDNLFLQFHNGGIYVYKACPASVLIGLMNAESAGKYFHSHIRNVYQYEKLEGEEDKVQSIADVTVKLKPTTLESTSALTPPPTPPAMNAEPEELTCDVQIVGELKTSTPLSAGYDLFAKVKATTFICAGSRALIDTGIKIAMPDNLCALVVPRSGLAYRHGISITNAPGLIDPDYRGTIGVIVENRGDSPFVINGGDKIAQLLFVPFVRPNFVKVGALDETSRGEGGFGSTGNN